MRKVVVSLLLVCLVGAAIAAWILSAPRPAFADTDAAALEVGGDAARGRLVFDAGDCASCHASRARPTGFASAAG